jgi:HTH-type transcriptional regulator/antitoxin HigA
VLVALIEAYEIKHYDFGPADPVEAIKFRVEQEGLTPRDLEPYIGQSGRVSEVLNRKRPLSLRMVKKLHDGLKILYESLMAGAISSGSAFRWTGSDAEDVELVDYH